tara:strand:- start:329 stop:1132 length:804 start_codon:yes stop_codon:yes gene_type:complete
MFFIVCLSLFLFANSKYNEHIARVAVNISQAAYCVSESEPWSCATCDSTNKLEAIIEKHGERTLVGYNIELDSLFVSFRGSIDILNWIDDIQIQQIKPYDNQSIEVEKGFYKAYQYLKSDVMNSLNNMKTVYSTKKLLLTGHSLGAAIATLMAFDVLHDYQVLLYTYGSPRIGNKYFTKSFENVYEMYRITHYYDIVPHTPPEYLNYRHLSNEVWYSEDNDMYKTCEDNYEEEDKTCSDSCAPIHCTSTSDHLNYLHIPMGSSTGLC